MEKVLFKKLNSSRLKIASISENINKPGTAQVGAISKAQKDSKTTFSTTGDNKSSQKTKNWEKKFRIFFEFFFEVSGKSHVPKNVKGGTLFISC